MTEYKESKAPDGDARLDMLDHLANGEPWAFIVAKDLPGDEFNLAVEVGGGIRDAATVRALLTKTLRALPEDNHV
ncbi:hypothetical protein [Actinoplanes palleronii]|uniref:Uncharacterized protein n=1 Tax=Actinoplanes palleronii TaxID=113570 RepID=A0ABQ4BJC8_9ACTN|nr:hypothetical protein [Actinoplanes palleronii]GIE70773.1 hypothetical protein Apa02nite_068810 [Actinoplanes palleronii]